MKKIIGIFIIAFISIGIADLIIGVILTLIYTPNPYTTKSMKMTNSLQYAISAATVTISLWCVYKAKNRLKSSKGSMEIS